MTSSGVSRQVGHPLPRLPLTRLGQQRAVDLARLQQGDQQRRDHAPILHPGDRFGDARGVPFPRRLQPLPPVMPMAVVPIAVTWPLLAPFPVIVHSVFGISATTVSA